LGSRDGVITGGEVCLTNFCRSISSANPLRAGLSERAAVDIIRSDRSRRGLDSVLFGIALIWILRRIFPAQCPRSALGIATDLATGFRRSKCGTVAGCRGRVYIAGVDSFYAGSIACIDASVGEYSTADVHCFAESAWRGRGDSRSWRREGEPRLGRGHTSSCAFWVYIVGFMRSFHFLLQGWSCLHPAWSCLHQGCFCRLRRGITPCHPALPIPPAT
jgi:hypothetical protein